MLSPTFHKRSRTGRPQEDTKTAGPEAPAAIPAEWGEEARGGRHEDAAPLLYRQLYIHRGLRSLSAGATPMFPPSWRNVAVFTREEESLTKVPPNYR